jgi:hypothetical protein
VTSSNLVAQLNASWRVIIDDDGKQWILQRLHENGWRARSYCRTRYALENCVRLYAGEIDPEAVAILAALPSNAHWTDPAPPLRKRTPGAWLAKTTGRKKTPKPWLEAGISRSTYHRRLRAERKTIIAELLK